MAQRLDTDHRNGLADARAAKHNAGSLEIRSGTQPADPNDAATGDLLATITLPDPAFSAAAAGVAEKTGTWSASVAASGEAGWARFLLAGTESYDVNVTGTGGGGEIEIDDVNLVEGGTVTVNTYTITQPAE